MLQPTTSATPRGTAVKVFSIRSGGLSGFGPGFSQTAVAGVRVISVQA